MTSISMLYDLYIHLFVRTVQYEASAWCFFYPVWRVDRALRHLARRRGRPVARGWIDEINNPVAIDGQMGHTTRHYTNTTQHDTTRHDTARHDPLFVSCRASTPCRLLGPYTTRDLLSRVEPGRWHGQHAGSCPTRHYHFCHSKFQQSNNQ
jgi:hypothetical protein